MKEKIRLFERILDANNKTVYTFDEFSFCYANKAIHGIISQYDIVAFWTVNKNHLIVVDYFLGCHIAFNVCLLSTSVIPVFNVTINSFCK